MTGEKLNTLQNAHFNGSHVTVNNTDTLEIWADTRIIFPHFTVKIEEKLNDEKLAELNNFLNQHKVVIKGETTYRVIVEIKGDFSEAGLALIHQMIIDQKIISFELLRRKNRDGYEEGIKIETVKVFFDVLKKGHQSLKNLTLNVDYLNDESLSELNCLLEEFTPETLFLGIQGEVRLERLTLINEMLRLQKIVSLKLGCSRMGDEGAKNLAETLKTNTTVTELDLGCNNMGSAGLQALADTLTTNTTLTKASFYENDIQDVGAKYLAKALTINKTLTSLNLASTKIGDEGAQALAAALYQRNIVKMNSFTRFVFNYFLGRIITFSSLCAYPNIRRARSSKRSGSM